MSKFLKFIVNLFLTVAILTAAAILVPPFLGVNTTIVDTAGMDTNLPLGSVTYSVDIPVTKLQDGDEILKENGTSTYAYIIEEGDVSTGRYKVSSAVDRESVTEITIRNTISLVKLSIPYIGYVVVAMQTVEGIIIIVLVVLFIIILFVLSELWKSRDDDDDDDDDEGTTTGYEALSSEYDEHAAAIEQDFSEAQNLSDESEVEQEMIYEGTPKEPATEDVAQYPDSYAYPESDTHNVSGSFGGEEYTGNVSDSVYYENAAYAEETEIGADRNSTYEMNGADLGTAAAAAGTAAFAGQGDKFGTWNTTDMNFAAELEKGLASKSAADEATYDGAAYTEETDPAWTQGAYTAAPDRQIEQPVYEQAAAGEPLFEEPALQAAADEPAAPEPVPEIQNTVSEEPAAAAYEIGADFEDEIDIDLEPNQFIAARRLSLEEILEQARKRGDEPRVRKDEVSGVDIVDYSKLI